jgi:hypothetical protein
VAPIEMADNASAATAATAASSAVSSVTTRSQQQKNEEKAAAAAAQAAADGEDGNPNNAFDHNRKKAREPFKGKSDKVFMPGHVPAPIFYWPSVSYAAV